MVDLKKRTVSLKKSCTPHCWNVSFVVPVYKIAGKISTAKNYCPLSLLYVVSKVLLVDNRLVDHLEKFGLCSDFQCGFSSSWSTVDLVTVVFERTIKVIWAMTLDISKANVMVWHAGLLQKFKTYGIPGPVYGIILSFCSSRLVLVVLGENSLQ